MKALEMLKKGEIAILKGIEIFGNNDSDALKSLKEVRESIAELEAQEIMIADYKKRIAELEADNKELAKDFTHSKYVDKYVQIETPKSCLSCKYFSNVFKECNALDIKWSGVIENFYCSEYEPKDK